MAVEVRKIWVRKDTLQTWIQANPVLRENELVCVILVDGSDFTMNMYKIGDGKSSFAKLPFLKEIPNKFRVYSYGRAVTEINLNGVEILEEERKLI